MAARVTTLELFFTPYEAAAWTVIGHRIRMTQAATVMLELTTPMVEQLRAPAEAALGGRLGRDRLRAMDPDDAIDELQELPGIGPFSAELILIRGVGAPDLLHRHEPRLSHAARAAYGLPDDADLAPTAEAWRPYRSWWGSSSASTPAPEASRFGGSPAARAPIPALSGYRGGGTWFIAPSERCADHDSTSQASMTACGGEGRRACGSARRRSGCRGRRHASRPR